MLVLLLAACLHAGAQDTWYGPGYQTIIMKNPASAGSEGQGRLRLSYMNFFPGNSFNLHSVYLSYDTYAEALNGGIGVTLSNDYLGGILNDMRGGFSYAYFLQAGRDLYINAGLSASVYHRSFRFGGAILPDQIDPTGVVAYPSAETLVNTGRAFFDIGTGFIVAAGRFTGGFSINHLAQPYLSDSESPEERIARKLFIHLSADLEINERKNFVLQPLAFAELQGDYLVAGAGVVVGVKHLKINALVNTVNNGNIDLQTGFSISTGRLAVGYNYLFNVSARNTFMPFSLLHQTGVSLRLGNVEKSYNNKTINYPEL
jgi:type IX secretion system PorP/SprF family membrane protein